MICIDIMSRIIYQITCECGNKMDPRANFCKDCRLKKQEEKREKILKRKEERKNTPRQYYKLQKPQLPPFKSLYNSMVKTIERRNSKHSHITCELTFDDFLLFTQIPECYYCGDFVKWMPHRKSNNPFVYNLDRKNNTLGYTKENCVVCCPTCNKLKSTLTE